MLFHPLFSARLPRAMRAWRRAGRRLAVALGSLTLLVAANAPASERGPIAGFNTTTPYLIYYGNWTASQVDYARTNYHLVILHPASNITSNQIATIRRGKDNLAGTADDVLVLAYLSIGEDDRNGIPVVGDAQGPRVDPRTSDSDPLSGITNAIGLPSAGGTHFASYYLNARTNQTGTPDRNGTYGSYYVNAGSPAWWTVIKTMTKTNSGQAGLDEILTTAVGNGFNCDGVFLDTVDTAAPNNWGTPYEWTSPGMQGLVREIHTNYLSKLLMANRGLFFFDSNLKTYPYNLRAYIDFVMFESYYSDSGTNAVSTSFPDNKYDFAPKINAEAGRPDGFSVLVVDYDHTPPQTAAVINQDYVESMGIQGWPLYRTNPSLNETLNTNSALWLSTNADVLPPTWDSTAASSPTPPNPRVGIQQVSVGNQSATVYWDVAHDQTAPVRYNIYYATGTAMNFSNATKITHVPTSMPINYALGTGPGSYPYGYTITNLTNGTTYFFAVRAEDSAVPSHEDTNITAISAIPGTNGVTSCYRHIAIDGSFADWAGVPVMYQGGTDANPVNFVQVQFANDTNYLYGHFKLSAPYAAFTDYYTHLFVDTDTNNTTGYLLTGASFGSEMMIESGFGYDQRNGSFNAGGVSGLNWAISPTTAATEFEFRLSLATLYPNNAKVFGTNVMRLLLEDNRGPELSTETGLFYQLSSPKLGPLTIARSGNQVMITWLGAGTLQVTSSLLGSTWTNLPAANSPYVALAGVAQQFFRLAE